MGKRGEFELIDIIQARVATDPSVLLGIGDDAAVVATTPNQRLVTTTDSVVLDQHFELDWTPQDIGHLAMGVNLSDIAAMGATPKWALLALTLPKDTHWATPEWINHFLDGFLNVCPDIALIGGNFSQGPVNIGVCLMGEVGDGQWVTRSGASVGDCLVVTGTLGDAAAALALQQQNAPHIDEALAKRLRRPTPRLAAGQVGAKYASAMIDISDGLLADLSHLLTKSSSKGPAASLGARLELAALPCSKALLHAFPEEDKRWPLQLAGGSDYELLMAIPPSVLEDCLDALKVSGTSACVLGQVSASDGISLLCDRARAA